MNIPLVDLTVQCEAIGDEVLKAIERVARKAQFVLGEEVHQFEEEFAAYCDVRHGIGVASGTDALQLALRALDVGPGDEVITAANSFAATAFAVAYTGATPVFVDVHPEDYNIDVTLIEQAITPRTKAIVPVHLYGLPAEMDTIMNLADRYGLKVVEDACQAHGARYRGRRVGSFGDAACFSFYPGKNLGAFGDGGAIVTSDDDLAQRVRLLRNYGQKQKNEHTMLGYNSRLDTIQAAVLLVKLRYLDQWNEQRRMAAGCYDQLLADADLILPRVADHLQPVYHLYVIQHARRDDLLEYMRQRGVFGGIHYPKPLPQAAPLRGCRTVPDGVPESTRLADRIVSLPMFPELTSKDLHRVAEAVMSFPRQPVGVA